MHLHCRDTLSAAVQQLAEARTLNERVQAVAAIDDVLASATSNLDISAAQLSKVCLQNLTTCHVLLTAHHTTP